MKISINWLIVALIFVCLHTSKAQVQLSLANRNIPAQTQVLQIEEIEITQEQMDSMDRAEGLIPASPPVSVFSDWQKIFTPKKINMNAFNIRVDTVIEKQVERPLSDFILVGKGDTMSQVEIDEIETIDYREVDADIDKFPISEVEAYILRFVRCADEAQQKFKIPSAITLAQGILESNKGGSKMALKSKNHFGIKCNGGFGCGKKGHDKFYKDDRPHEAFRCYESPEDSYDDHSKFLKQNDRYDRCFACGDNIECWLAGLDKAGYATDYRYGEKLAEIINKYKLHGTRIEYSRKAFFARK